MFEGKPEDCQAKHLVADKVAEAAYRATLEAIREPSEAMLSDIPDAITRALENEGLSWRPYDIYQAVIDHLLNAKPSLEDERLAALEGK
jgi:hypothetical protein